MLGLRVPGSCESLVQHFQSMATESPSTPFALNVDYHPARVERDYNMAK